MNKIAFIFSCIFGVIGIILYIVGFIKNEFYPIALLFTFVQLLFVLIIRLNKN